jgi:hypothetical protein
MGAMQSGAADNRPVATGTGLTSVFQHFLTRKKNNVFPDIVPAGLTRRAPLGNNGKVSRKMNISTSDRGRRQGG